MDDSAGRTHPTEAVLSVPAFGEITIDHTSYRIARFRGLLITALACFAGGCAEELGPVPLRVVRVRGVVRERTHPISGGWIEFFPVEGTVGNLRSARLNADGSFEADQVAVGKNLIRFVNAPIESRGAAQLFGSYGSPIRRVIRDQPATPLDIDLVEEAIQYQDAQARETRTERSRSREPR